MSIVDELLNLRRPEIAVAEHDCKAIDVVRAICGLLSDIVLKDEAECDKLTDFEEEIRELQCKIIGEHLWKYDMCGYWGHQYCRGCHKSKYPELAKLRCSEAIEKYGDIKESEYLTEG